jgi:hypothetical protein
MNRLKVGVDERRRLALPARPQTGIREKADRLAARTWEDEGINYALIAPEVNPAMK